MNKLSVILLGAVLVLQASFGQAAEITVSGAASLTNAFTEVKGAFEAVKPGNTVATNFAASNPLLQQIREGAPADVFASADQQTMDKAQAENLIDPATRVNFVSNSLVLIVPKGQSTVKGAEDLSKAGRIAVGNPDSVPAGRYTRDALSPSGQYEALTPKFVLGESVRQVLDYVSRGEADAGFVYATDAYIAKDKVDIVATMGNHEPILYPVAVIASSANKALAKEFVNFLTSEQGMGILQSYGFSPAQ